MIGRSLLPLVPFRVTFGVLVGILGWWAQDFHEPFFFAGRWPLWACIAAGLAGGVLALALDWWFDRRARP